jgi:hypothetical protein
VQRLVIAIGFEWFYPNDLLLLARKQAHKADVILNIDYLDGDDLKITIHLVQ